MTAAIDTNLTIQKTKGWVELTAIVGAAAFGTAFAGLAGAFLGVSVTTAWISETKYSKALKQKYSKNDKYRRSYVEGTVLGYSTLAVIAIPCTLAGTLGTLDAIHIRDIGSIRAANNLAIHKVLGGAKSDTEVVDIHALQMGPDGPTVIGKVIIGAEERGRDGSCKTIQMVSERGKYIIAVRPSNKKSGYTACTPQFSNE